MENAKRGPTSNDLLDTPMEFDAHDGLANVADESDEPTIPKRTRSQLTVPDMILHVPLARSPLKNARRAQGRSQLSHPRAPYLQPEAKTSGGEPLIDIAYGPQVSLHETQDENDDMMDVRADVPLAVEGRKEEDGRGLGMGDGVLLPHRSATAAASAKKRMPPDDPARVLVDRSDEHQPKRAKLEAIRALGRREASVGDVLGNEHDVPLGDHDGAPRAHGKPFVRASSTRPMHSPGKLALSPIFPRAKSVPLEVDAVPSVDLTAIPPSPRRSPSRVELKRAPSQPPPEVMDVDTTEPSSVGLAHFTNATSSVLHADTRFNYTVNFATPRVIATPARNPLMTPLSPLTPLPPTPFEDRLPRMRSLLAKKANAKMDVVDRVTDVEDVEETPRTFSTFVRARPLVPAHFSIDFTTTNISTSRPSSAASTSSIAISDSSERFHSTQSRLLESRITPSSSADLMPPPPVPAKSRATGKASYSGLSDSTGADPAPPNSEGLTKPNNEPDSACNPNAVTSGPHSDCKTETPVAGPSKARPSIIGAMKKRVPSAPTGPRRMTRSVSLREEMTGREGNDRVESGGTEDDDNNVPPTLTSVARTSSSKSTSANASSSTSGSKPLPSKLTSTSTSSAKAPFLHTNACRSTPGPNKMKQTSINLFMKPSSMVTTFGNAPSSGVSKSSPSKIPVPISNTKRALTTQKSVIKPSSAVSTGPMTGRSLSTLSHALEKLVVPPPSRPNTSLGFVEAGAMDNDDVQNNHGDGTNKAIGVVKDKGKGKARDDTSVPFTSAIAHQTAGTSTSFARPTASSLKRAATVTGSMVKPFSTSSLTARVGTRGLAVGGNRGTVGIFHRAGERASKKTSLPTVVGSPVKGSIGEGVQETIDPGTESDSCFTVSNEDEGGLQKGGDATSEERFDDANGCRKASSPESGKGVDIDLSTSPVSSADKGKRIDSAPSLALNPASSALHALSESLSSLPQTSTPQKPRAVGTRTGLRSATIAKGSPASDGSGSAGPSSRGDVETGARSNVAGGNSSGVSHKKSTLKVLKKCCIFVDVRTEQGDDAGSLFVDMLRGLGAKILSRVGQSCTHIVFKNGQPNTLMRYRLLNDPKPYVVGIAWVVECVEQRARIDEDKFKVDLDLINVTGGNKRRRSMLPKHLVSISPGGSIESPAHPSSEADEEEGGAAGCNNASPLQDPDTSVRSRDEDDLPPLERARRRRSVLPGGQTRLIL